MASTTTTTGPPSPPFTRESAVKRYASPRTAGTPATQERQLWPTRPIHDGGIARSSSTDQTKSSLFSLASGPRSWTTGSSRNCGRSPATASRCTSLTSGTTTRVTGIAPVAMRIGSSVTMGSWLYGSLLNDLPIPESDRQYHWPLGRRPDELSRIERPGASSSLVR